MNYLNVPKLIGAIVLVVSMTALMWHGTVSSEAGVPFLTAVGGYILGNGIAARKGDPIEPIIGSTRKG